MRQPSARTRVGLVGAIVAGVLVTGCATIPVAGPVRAGRNAAYPTEGGYVRVLPVRPRPGAGRAEIVRGFLDASAATDDVTAAQAFLTPAAIRAWDPRSGVEVYRAGSATIVADGGEDVVTVDAPLVGRLSSDGVYTPADPAGRLHAEFRLARQHGQWRVAGVPDGLLLTDVDLARSWQPAHAYFLDAAGVRLVPDPMLVRRGPGLATMLVKRLLAGPSSWLRGSVTTAFPAGTGLSGSVPIDGGVAHVDLTAAALEAPPPAREAMSAQLVWTLAQVDGVDAVTISVAGTPLSVPNAAVVQPVESWFGYDPAALPAGASAYVVRHGQLGTLTGTDQSSFTPLEGPAAPALSALVEVAVSPDGRTVAGLSADRRSLYVAALDSGRAQAPPVVRARGQRLSGPSVDASGTVWVAELGSARPVLRALPPAGAAGSVGLGLPAGQRLVAFSVARDGTRVALVTRADHPGVPDRLYVAGVIGLAAGSNPPSVDRHLRLGPLRRLGPGVYDVVDLAWSAADEIAVLDRPAADDPHVAFVALNGLSVRESPSLPNAIRLAAAPGALPLLVLVGTATGARPQAGAGGDGVVYRLAGRRWVPLGPGHGITYPG